MVDPPTHAAIFDVDGVIVDTIGIHQRTYAELGVEAQAWTFGRPWRDWLPQRVGSLKEAERINQEKKRLHCEALKNGVVPLAGYDALCALESRGWKVALCSHSTHEMLYEIRYHLGLDHVAYASTVGGHDKVWHLRTLADNWKKWYGITTPVAYVDDNFDEGRRCATLAELEFVPFINDCDKLVAEIVHVTGA